ncbi:MAG: hypothetical protein QOK28_3571 [Actinomycetota bacterium]
MAMIAHPQIQTSDERDHDNPGQADTNALLNGQRRMQHCRLPWWL